MAHHLEFGCLSWPPEPIYEGSSATDGHICNWHHDSVNMMFVGEFFGDDRLKIRDDELLECQCSLSYINVWSGQHSCDPRNINIRVDALRDQVLGRCQW